MSESDDLDRLQAPMAQRQQALRSLREHAAAWGVALPENVTPLVLDFGLGEFANTGLVECWICNEMQAGYCGKYMFVEQNQQCPMHRHQFKHETFLIVKGRAELTLSGKTSVLEPGQILSIPTGQWHRFAGSGGAALLLELSMPCDPRDNEFENPRIMRWLESALRLSPRA
ncbi:MAG: D-lyxose/D-mannose family sugar isomerase [Phycisphaeraceae bacterium]|nr:D-lyxose/D-mannose family sugar isomerase [Phycisphaeraceae bacterium]